MSNRRINNVQITYVVYGSSHTGLCDEPQESIIYPKLVYEKVPNEWDLEHTDFIDFVLKNNIFCNLNLPKKRIHSTEDCTLTCRFCEIWKPLSISWPDE
jgi:hypothetical protein